LCVSEGARKEGLDVCQGGATQSRLLHDPLQDVLCICRSEVPAFDLPVRFQVTLPQIAITVIRAHALVSLYKGQVLALDKSCQRHRALGCCTTIVYWREKFVCQYATAHSNKIVRTVDAIQGWHSRDANPRPHLLKYACQRETCRADFRFGIRV